MRTTILSLFLIPFFLFAAEVKSYDFVVAKDGTGNFATMQDAINAVPDFRKKETNIYIKNGIYHEKIMLPGSELLVTLVGEDKFKTIINYNDYAQKKNRFGEEIGISGSTSFYRPEVEFAKKQKGKKIRTVTLDNYFNNEYKKTASGQVKPYHYLWDGEDNNGFSLLGRIFEKNGGQLNTLRTAPTLQNLAKSNIYIIVDPDTEKETEHPHFMNETDAQQIAQWVKQGGVLVLFLNDSGNCEITKFNTLAKKFGITFNEDSRNRVKGNDFPTGAIAIPKGNAVFPNTSQIYIKEISTLQVKAPAQTLIQDHGDTIIATAKYGKGTVFAIGDPWFYNEYTDGRKLPKEYENSTAANDLVYWLFKQINN
ncbi:pectinesterase family protein [Sphingobacterium sp.]|uniref:pectinesterase family protein n=1 Tax=Sphingobacterium sp. TaxID=341027 RepID=UPI002FDDCBF4